MALIVPGQEALRTGHADIALTRRLVELTGFEPVAPSLRKVRSKLSDQGKRLSISVLWRGCGTRDASTPVSLWGGFLASAAICRVSNHLLRLVRKAHKGARVRVISIG